MENVPYEVIPGDFFSALSIARGYEGLGRTDKMMESIRFAEPLVLDRFAEATSERDIQRLQQFIQMIQIAYFKVGDFESAARFTRDLSEVAGDTALVQTAEELENMYGQFAQPRLLARPQSSPANERQNDSSSGAPTNED